MPAEVPLEIDIPAARALLSADASALLLDVREPQEYDLVHLPQSEFIPMSQLAARADELAPWRERPLVVLCHHGGRSLRVVHWLRQQGFAQAQSLAGGIDAWAEQVDPSLPRY